MIIKISSCALDFYYQRITKLPEESVALPYIVKLEANNIFNLFESSKYKSFTLNFKQYLKIIGNFSLSGYEIEEI